MNGCRIRGYSAPRELCHFSYIGWHAVSAQRGLQWSEPLLCLRRPVNCLGAAFVNTCSTTASHGGEFWSRCIQAELLQTTKKLLQVIDRRLSVSTAGEPVYLLHKGHVIDAWILQ